MKKFILFFFLVCTCFTGFSDNAEKERAKTTTVSGKVVDASGQEVAGAKIIIKETGETVYTDFNGQFRINVSKKAKYVILVEMTGFIPATFETNAVNIPEELKLNDLGTQQYR